MVSVDVEPHVSFLPPSPHALLAATPQPNKALRPGFELAHRTYSTKSGRFAVAWLAAVVSFMSAAALGKMVLESEGRRQRDGSWRERELSLIHI